MCPVFYCPPLHLMVVDVYFIGSCVLLHTPTFDPRLRTLWVNFNEIDRLFPWIDNLNQSFGNLQYLSMMGNPAAPRLNKNTIGKKKDLFKLCYVKFD